MLVVVVDNSDIRVTLTDDSFPGLTAWIDRRGASLVGLRVNGVDAVVGYPLTDNRPLSAGIVMAPWPNRIRHGVWQEGDTHHQLAITEPDVNNAIHGLCQDVAWSITDHSHGSVTLHHRITDAPGYPFDVNIDVTYSLHSDGIGVTLRAKNLSDRPAPFAGGAHPYLQLGVEDLEEATLTVNAGTVIVNDERLLPVGRVDVTGEVGDVRLGRRVAELELDNTFCLDGDGPWVTTLHGQHTTVTVWQESPLRYMHVFTTRNFPGTDGPITAVALEPTSAPADSFNSGEGVTWIAPDDEWSASWGIRVEAHSPVA